MTRIKAISYNTHIMKRLQRLLASPCCRPLLRASSGFTVVETMVVLAVAAILAMLAAPGFKPMLDRWRVREAVEAMTSTLYLARSEAVRRGGNIVVGKNPAGGECAHTSLTTEEWSCGWMVFVETGTNDTYNSGTDILIQTFPAPRDLNVMNKNNAKSFRLDRWGMANLNAMRFVISPDSTGISSPATTTLCMSSGGRIRVLQDEVTCPSSS